MRHRPPLRRLALWAGLALVLTTPLEALARIKLITLPVREKVEIRLDHPDATLVEEERLVPLIAGENQVDFSWANTRIDPGSILFRLIPEEKGVKAQVLSVSYPPNENALVWNLSADRSGPARVRIAYLLGGLERSFNYRAVAANDEKSLDLSLYLKLNNQANESYEEAVLKAGFGNQLQRPVELAETRELLLARFPQVAIRKRYTADLTTYGYIDAPQKKLKIPMHYVLENDAAHGLGQAALPYGKARIFLDDGKGGSAFVGEDWGQFTPRDDEQALYLGVARDIVVKRTIDRNDRTRISGDLYDYDLVVKYEIENFKEQPATLDIVEGVRAIRAEIGRDNPRDPEWKIGDGTTLPGGPDPEHSDGNRLLYHVPLAARPKEGKAVKQELRLHLALKNEW